MSDQNWIQADMENLNFAGNTAQDIIRYSTVPGEAKQQLVDVKKDFEMIVEHLAVIASFAGSHNLQDLLERNTIYSVENKWLAEKAIAEHIERHPNSWTANDLKALSNTGIIFHELSEDYENLHENSSDKYLFSKTRLSNELIHIATSNYKIATFILNSSRINDNDRATLDSMIADREIELMARRQQNEYEA